MNYYFQNKLAFLREYAKLGLDFKAFNASRELAKVPFEFL
ncbi:hypothetical protein HMPREF9257_0210 [Eremococcus coleocola ACS-139-V-Col8]|uniref:Uncharacterized protein n=1 Tax=Eremococcus coleocola ACS-139-V-Col8 TaxID=908337 RepID=E4KMZ7_9LACT|nr:hypothetical protein HMPREF9257_0210 [Eremococcus coleocola ACS-139-V-Col8]